MQESIKQFEKLSKKDQKEVLNLIKLKNVFKEQEIKRKVKKYDEILEYLKEKIKFYDEEMTKTDDEEEKLYCLYKKMNFDEILTKMEEGK